MELDTVGMMGMLRGNFEWNDKARRRLAIIWGM